MTFDLRCGDCRDVLDTLDANTFDSVITDPPYHLLQASRGRSRRINSEGGSPFGRHAPSKGFMDKEWDGGQVAFQPDTWAKVLRVAKPGSLLLAFGGTRTWHRLACAIEDAGWEIKDTIVYMYGSGMPKGLNIAKAIDQMMGAERPVVGRYQPPSGQAWHLKQADDAAVDAAPGSFTASGRRTLAVTGPATDAAAAWEGWNSALKPAWEPILVAQKPLDRNYAHNALTWGVAGFNIDGCRIPVGEAGGRPLREIDPKATDNHTYAGRMDGSLAGGSRAVGTTTLGRWPANVILDPDAAAMLDAQSGPRGAAAPVTGSEPSAPIKDVYGQRGRVRGAFHGDSGGASRFFYCSKVSKSERNAGLPEGMENTHPTVKPVNLLRFLCRLTAVPTHGVVLDPFCGSGSTGVAALLEGRSFIGIDREAEYIEIARARLVHAAAEVGAAACVQPSLF